MRPSVSSSSLSAASDGEARAARCCRGRPRARSRARPSRAASAVASAAAASAAARARRARRIVADQPEHQRAGEQHRAEARGHREAAVVRGLRHQQDARRSEVLRARAASAPSALQVMTRWNTRPPRKRSASSTAATLSGLLPERANDTSSVGPVRRQAQVGPAQQVGRRNRLDAAAQPRGQGGREAVADVRRRAGAGQHDAQVRIRDERLQEGIEARALAGDQLADRGPHLRLLRDLARRPRRAARLQLGRGETREFRSRSCRRLRRSTAGRDVGTQRRCDTLAQDLCGVHCDAALAHGLVLARQELAQQRQRNRAAAEALAASRRPRAAPPDTASSSGSGRSGCTADRTRGSAPSPW